MGLGNRGGLLKKVVDAFLGSRDISHSIFLALSHACNISFLLLPEEPSKFLQSLHETRLQGAFAGCSDILTLLHHIVESLGVGFQE